MTVVHPTSAPQHSAGCQIYEKAAEVRQKHEAEVAAVEKAKVQTGEFFCDEKRRRFCVPNVGSPDDEAAEAKAKAKAKFKMKAKAKPKAKAQEEMSSLESFPQMKELQIGGIGR